MQDAAYTTFPIEWVVGCGETAAVDPTAPIPQPEEADEYESDEQFVQGLLTHYGVAWESALVPWSLRPKMGYKLAGQAEADDAYGVIVHLALNYGYQVPEWIVEYFGIGECDLGTCDCEENSEATNL